MAAEHPQGVAIYFNSTVCKWHVLANDYVKKLPPSLGLLRLAGNRRDRKESQDVWLAPAVGGREEGHPRTRISFDEFFSWGGRLEDGIRGEGAEPDLSQRDSVEATAAKARSVLLFICCHLGRLETIAVGRLCDAIEQLAIVIESSEEPWGDISDDLLISAVKLTQT